MQNYKIWVLAIALACTLCAWLWWPRTDVLIVQDATGTVLLTAPLPTETEFGIRFVHSVAKSPVEEWFVAQDGVIVLRRTVYRDFGAGLPHEAGPGQRMDFVDGTIVLTGFDMRLPQLTVRVGRVAEHTLLLPQGAGTYREVLLTQLAAPGAALTFTVGRERALP